MRANTHTARDVFQEHRELRRSIEQVEAAAAAAREREEEAVTKVHALQRELDEAALRDMSRKRVSSHCLRCESSAETSAALRAEAVSVCLSVCLSVSVCVAV